MYTVDDKTAYCFDLDGTVTQAEILPEIAEVLGIKDEINVLTKATMDGLLNFESSFKLRVKLLATVPIEEVSKIIAKIQLNEKLVEFININSKNCYIVTGNLDVWIKIIQDKLKCKIFSSSAELENNQIVGIKNIVEKGTAIQALREIGYQRIIAVGDGMNDVSMFEAADCSIAFGGVHDPFNTLIQIADYITYDEEGLCQLLRSL